MKKAFTLAEVLITLGIIGVVAAMTLPGIFIKLRHKSEVTALKKAYSLLSQAYLNIVNEQGVIPAELCLNNDSRCLGDLFDKNFKFISKTLWIPNNQIAAGCWEDSNLHMPHELHYCTVTADGIVYNFDMEIGSGSSGDITAIVSVDTNGTQRPNIWGRDRYLFFISRSKGVFAPERFGSSTVVCNDGNGGLLINSCCAYKYLYEE